LFICFRDPVDDLVIRTISSQLRFRAINGQSYLNWCFEALSKYYPRWDYPYIVIDGSSQATANWFRVKSKIFPENGIIEPICFVPNPNAK
jgi:hypothetical protein